MGLEKVVLEKSGEPRSPGHHVYDFIRPTSNKEIKEAKTVTEANAKHQETVNSIISHCEIKKQAALEVRRDSDTPSPKTSLPWFVAKLVASFPERLTTLTEGSGETALREEVARLSEDWIANNSYSLPSLDIKSDKVILKMDSSNDRTEIEVVYEATHRIVTYTDPGEEYSAADVSDCESDDDRSSGTELMHDYITGIITDRYWEGGERDATITLHFPDGVTTKSYQGNSGQGEYYEKWKFSDGTIYSKNTSDGHTKEQWTYRRDDTLPITELTRMTYLGNNVEETLKYPDGSEHQMYRNASQVNVSDSDEKDVVNKKRGKSDETDSSRDSEDHENKRRITVEES